MSNRDNEPSNNTPVPLPCCPHCGEELPAVGCFNWQVPNGFLVLCVFCQNPACRRALEFAIVPVGVQAEQSRIARPH